MSKYSSLMTSTLQSEPIKGEEHKQARNHAGGFVYKMDKFQRLERFLILGSDANTFYQKAPELTKENAECVNECWLSDPSLTADMIRMISVEGRAPRNSPAIFALVLGCLSKDELTRKHAHLQIPLVCRTSTHLFEFVDTYDKLGGKGFGRGMKRAISNWYNNKTDDELAYQLVKYRQREGYTHERMIKRCRPKKTATTSEGRQNMYDWLCGRIVLAGELPSIMNAHIVAMQVVKEGAELENLSAMIAREHLPREALPTWMHSEPKIIRSMLPTMPITALMRNLGNMTRLNVFDDELTITAVFTRLTNEYLLRKGRVHPFNILNASVTYEQGHGFRGQNSWMPTPEIKRALDKAFYKSFSTITPTGKRICIALDISPSMEGHQLFNSALNAREASAAMAMATVNSEPEENVSVVAFSSMNAHNYYGIGSVSNFGGALLNVKPMVKKGASLSSICSYTRDLPYVGTDCSLPMLAAMEQRASFDAFIIYTDNETFAGNVHPSEALRQYRQSSGIEDAKLIVVGMTSTGFSIADPDDANMLDVVGFNSDAPAVIASFINRSHAANAQHEGNIRLTSSDNEEENSED